MFTSPSHRIHIGVAALVLLVTSTGCGTPTSPGHVSTVAMFAVHSGSTEAPAGATFPPTITADGSGIVVLGLMGTPVPCYVIGGSRSKFFDHMTIKVTAQPVGQGCIDSVATFAYRATTPLPPGTYVVEVVHEYLEWGGSTSVGRQEVVRKETVIVP